MLSGLKSRYRLKMHHLPVRAVGESLGKLGTEKLRRQWTKRVRVDNGARSCGAMAAGDEQADRHGPETLDDVAHSRDLTSRAPGSKVVRWIQRPHAIPGETRPAAWRTTHHHVGRHVVDRPFRAILP